MKRNRHDLRTTAVLAAAAAAGLTLWTSAAASETRPADFETEFELDLPVQPAAETAAPALPPAVVAAETVGDGWECCDAVELVASEASMKGWGEAVSNYLDRYFDRPADGEAVASELVGAEAVERNAIEVAATDAAAAIDAVAATDAVSADAEHVSAASTDCEFCAKLLATLNEEVEAYELAILAAEAEAIFAEAAPEPVEWQLLTPWSVARFAAISRTLDAIGPVPASDGGDTCFRIPASDERRASAD